jgi:hypothetical protein
MEATTQRFMTPTRRGVLAGVLGALGYLPVMILLQPTVFATIVLALFPAAPPTAGEFLGWLLHVALLIPLAIALAHLLETVQRPAVLLTAAVGWSFLAGWGVAFAAAMMGLPWPVLGWLLEGLAHVVNGLVVGAVLIYVQRLIPAAHAASAAS